MSILTSLVALEKSEDYVGIFEEAIYNCEMSKNNTAPKNMLRLFITGFAMGIADLIPGVSGGTIAFMSGIYEELLFTIKLLSKDFLKLIIRGKIKEGWRIIPFRFILPLGIGLLSAVFSLSQLMAVLLKEQTTFVYSFFFGLVVASIVVVLKKVKKWYVTDFVFFLLSAALTYYVVGLIPVDTPKNLLTVFLSGAIAICAMILPGISGSFILLLLGKYHYILNALNNFDVITIIVFMFGCIFGLSIFSRFLSWLFHHHHDISVIVLAGVMAGSLSKIWPWQEVVQTRINSHGETVPIITKSFFPSRFDDSFFIVLLFMIVGFMVVFLLDKIKVTEEHVDDIDSKSFQKEHVESTQTH